MNKQSLAGNLRVALGILLFFAFQSLSGRYFPATQQTPPSALAILFYALLILSGLVLAFTVYRGALRFRFSLPHFILAGAAPMLPFALQSMMSVPAAVTRICYTLCGVFLFYAFVLPSEGTR